MWSNKIPTVIKCPITLKSKVQKYNTTTYSPNKLLSDENLQQTVKRFSKLKLVRQLPLKTVRNAAVLIPICMVDDKVSLLYTLRAASLKTHRGQVSFPGGMQEEDEKLEETALRETEEELGLSRWRIGILGTGNAVLTRGETCVLPVIGQINKNLDIEKDLKINTEEVKDVFTVTIEDLCNPKNLKYTQFKGQFSTPVFLGGKLRIWGLTAVITHLFLDSFLPKDAYRHPIRYSSLS